MNNINKPTIFLTSFLILAIIAYGCFYFLKSKKNKQSSWIFDNQTLSTGVVIPHVKTISFKTTEYIYTSIVDVKNDLMQLSVKKINNNDSVWLINQNNDFDCISKFIEKCSITVTFDNNPPITYTYDGGDKKTIYIINSKNFIKNIRKSSEVKIRSVFKKPVMTNVESNKETFNSGGVFSNVTNKEYSFKTFGFIWNLS
ncbi:hypothetical protein GW796_08630 [archaeon]|nr:hypothetical protein [archaeon]NCQ51944.1 hypothetical protein [archaeon]